ncbi:PTS system protein [Klebsiella pneumoniae]|uniref:PTS system protein n=1 Tax=Klebsiella pneumoniae TaxID=573 RepID=A0A447S0K0_KLEPN|nr:PTS system protein [Klebsiella pneumoniae]
MVERIGLQLTVVDTGWPTASTIGWGSPLMLPVVVGFIVINAGHASVEINQNGEYRYF